MFIPFWSTSAPTDAAGSLAAADAHEPKPTAQQVAQRKAQRRQLDSLCKSVGAGEGLFLGRAAPGQMARTAWADMRLQVTRVAQDVCQVSKGTLTAAAMAAGIGYARTIPVHWLVAGVAGLHVSNITGIAHRLLPSAKPEEGEIELGHPLKRAAARAPALPAARTRTPTGDGPTVAEQPNRGGPALTRTHSEASSAANALVSDEDDLTAHDGPRRLADIERLAALATDCDALYFERLHTVQKLRAAAAVHQSQVRAIDEQIALRAAQSVGQLPGQNYYWCMVATGSVFLGASLGIFAAILWLIPSSLCIVLARHLFARNPGVDQATQRMRDDAAAEVERREVRIGLELRKAREDRARDERVRNLTATWVA